MPVATTNGIGLPREAGAALVTVVLLAPGVGGLGCATDSGTSASDEETAEAREPERRSSSDAEGEDTAEADETDEPAKIGREELNATFESLRDALESSDLADKWNDADESEDAILVAVLPFRDEVGEPSRVSVSTFPTKFETYLVNEMPVSVVNMRAQSELIQQEQEDDDVSFAESIRRAGVDYVLTGTLSHAPDGDAYRVKLRAYRVDEGTVAFETTAPLTANPD